VGDETGGVDCDGGDDDGDGVSRLELWLELDLE
jgi:hypothetical protein